MIPEAPLAHPGSSALDSLFTGISSLWEPKPRVPLSQWAEENVVLSSEYSARSTNLKLFGWQKAVFDAFTDPEVQEIVLCCSTQLLKTLLLQCIVMYVIVMDPGPILLVQPNDDDARTFSKERLGPMIRDNACLHGLLADTGQGGRDTITGKSFPGGSLSLVGAISPSNLARRSIRYLLCDEINKYPFSAGAGDKSEGDPITLAWKRTSTYEHRRKRVLCCSPTTAGASRINDFYRQTDMRKPWVACPHCGFAQILRWEQVKDVSGGSFSHNGGATARYECANLKCKAKWTDLERREAADRAVWRAERPFTGAAGFWISHLYSPWSTHNLPVLAKEYLAAGKDVNLLRAFKNTTLALEWEEEGEAPDHQVLYDRREHYRFGSPETAVVPARGLFLTCAVDVQESPPRLEYEVVAWGRYRECWSVCYGSIEASAENGEPLPVTSREIWDKLDTDVLQREWKHESGRAMPIWLMGIDTGRRPKPVYEFARRHAQLRHTPAGYSFQALRTVVPVKGTADPLKLLSSVSKEDAARKQQGVRIIGVGTHCAKQEIYDTLRHARPKANGSLSGAPSPGCMHHPEYEMAYFRGLCGERRVVSDRGKVDWVQVEERNEPLDLKVYNRAMAAVAGIDRWGEDQWKKLEWSLRMPTQGEAGPGSPPTVATPQESPAAPVASDPRRRGLRGGFQA